jgi:cation transport ATPase
VAAATEKSLTTGEVTAVTETPGQGLVGHVIDSGGAAHEVMITSRQKLAGIDPEGIGRLPPQAAGLECVVVVGNKAAGVLRFRDSPRADGRTFVKHLGPAHGLSRVMLVSGDREGEVRWLADVVGITDVHAEVSPEGKLAIVEAEVAKAPTVFVGDGINDAPAMAAATVGIAMGTANDVTAEAAGAVVMDQALERVDELFHVARRMRVIALQSALGGMAASLVGMGFAAAGLLPPAVGALVQEAIDIAAVLNALRVSWRPGELSDIPALQAGRPGSAAPVSPTHPSRL